MSNYGEGVDQGFGEGMDYVADWVKNYFRRKRMMRVVEIKEFINKLEEKFG